MPIDWAFQKLKKPRKDGFLVRHLYKREEKLKCHILLNQQMN